MAGLFAVLTGWLAFSNGGFDPVHTAAAAVVALAALLVFVTCAQYPASSLSLAGVLAAGALTLLAIWTLISANWSQAPGRALVEFDRALLYLAVFLLMASLSASRMNARWMIRLAAVALGAAVLAGLVSRLEPGFSAEAARQAGDRLGWPLGYWNALGLAGALAGVACLHLASDLQEPRPVRVLAAAAVPALMVTIYLTLSRGAIVAGLFGIVVLLSLGRARGMASALLAVVPFSLYAVLQAYGTESLLDGSLKTVSARTEASAVRDAIVLACVGAALVRLVCLFLDAWVARLTLWRQWSPRRTTLVLLVLTVCVTAAAFAAGADRIAAGYWKDFTEAKTVTVEDQRDRLAATSANGRIEHWQVALKAWRDEPVLGTGAGTYGKVWARERESSFNVQDAHSLFFETLSELGVVGLALLGVALLTPLIAVALRRREDRMLWSAVMALSLTWAVHAGIDWDWEMPALTLPIVALLGAACARDTAPPDDIRKGRVPQLGRLPRLLVGLGILLLMITPVRVGLSQHYLQQSLTAFQAGDCSLSAARALQAIDMVGSRPQGFELLGYCDAKVGQHVLARRMLRAAQKRDPGSWDLHYGMALVRSVAGLDPRPEFRRAHRLNPLEDAVTDAQKRMRSNQPEVWIREGRVSPLPLPEEG